MWYSPSNRKGSRMYVELYEPSTKSLLFGIWPGTGDGYEKYQDRQMAGFVSFWPLRVGLHIGQADMHWMDKAKDQEDVWVVAPTLQGNDIPFNFMNGLPEGFKPVFEPGSQYGFHCNDVVYSDGKQVALHLATMYYWRHRRWAMSTPDGLVRFTYDLNTVQPTNKVIMDFVDGKWVVLFEAVSYDYVHEELEAGSQLMVLWDGNPVVGNCCMVVRVHGGLSDLEPGAYYTCDCADHPEGDHSLDIVACTGPTWKVVLDGGEYMFGFPLPVQHGRVPFGYFQSEFERVWEFGWAE